MYENSKEELELLKQQLERVKQQDRVLAEIEMRLNKMKKMKKMKKIVEYAAGYQLSGEESELLNKQLREHQAAIQSLENYLA
ncbi:MULTISPECIES: hypothetical protein [Sporosarcina]|uniref:Uncharacterized protein n=1 Tax=Sporosarcina newyorkensis TaxID=759851 RepID=A0A1T4Y373_9BACL|nr:MULTISPECIES: hypothetical protein [Sporosarcina]MBY0223482.1 hypothetical protein [Sporosarcina aquimarina]SKA95725.1 hypothetical protein SAMN04244570_1697 [Sporosarcina newyorkensis]